MTPLREPISGQIREMFQRLGDMKITVRDFHFRRGWNAALSKVLALLAAAEGAAPPQDFKLSAAERDLIEKIRLLTDAEVVTRIRENCAEMLPSALAVLGREAAPRADASGCDCGSDRRESARFGHGHLKWCRALKEQP